MRGRYWKTLLVVLGLSAQPTDPTGCGITGGRCPSRGNTTAAGAPIVASAACEQEFAALLGGRETDSIVMIHASSLNRAIVAATVRRASTGDRNHGGTAHLRGGSFATALGDARACRLAEPR
jgi:hypothetical protein